MAKFIRNITNALRPFKRIRKEIGAVRSEIATMRSEIVANIGVDTRNTLAYNILRDLNIAHKEAHLVALYPKNGGKVGLTQDFLTMQRYLNAVRPVRSDFISRNLVRVGGANDGGYIMINPKIDLFSANLALDSTQDSTHDSPPPHL